MVNYNDDKPIADNDGNEDNGYIESIGIISCIYNSCDNQGTYSEVAPLPFSLFYPKRKFSFSEEYYDGFH